MSQFDNISSREELIKKIKPKGVGVEVGVQAGVFSNCILENCKDLKLYLIDCWETQDFNIYPDIANVDLRSHAQALIHTISLNWKFFDRLKIIKDFSKNAVTYFKDESLDFIYLDANHKSEAFIEDLSLWYPKLKIGGLFAGHDYIDESIESGYGAKIEVKSAINNFSKEYDKIVYFTKENPENGFPSWFFIK